MEWTKISWNLTTSLRENWMCTLLFLGMFRTIQTLEIHHAVLHRSLYPSSVLLLWLQSNFKLLHKTSFYPKATNSDLEEKPLNKNHLLFLMVYFSGVMAKKGTRYQSFSSLFSHSLHFFVSMVPCSLFSLPWHRGDFGHGAELRNTVQQRRPGDSHGHQGVIGMFFT